MRRIFAISLILFSQNVWAERTTQYFISGTVNTANGALSTYGNVSGVGNGGWQSLANQAWKMMPSSGTWQNLRVWLDAAPGVGKSYTVSLMSNGSASGLSCSVSGTDTKCWNLSSSSFTTINDVVYMQSTPAGTPTSTRVHFAVEFVACTTNTFILGPTAQSIPNSAASYSTLTGQRGWATVETSGQAVFPTSGTFTVIKATITHQPTSGRSYDFTLRKNGSSTSLTCTISNTDTTCTGESAVSVKPGDLVYLMATPSGTPVTASAGVSLLFISSSTGEFPFFYQNQSGQSAAATNYQAINDQNSAGATTESQVQAPAISTSPSVQVINLYGWAQTAPGAGKSWTLSLRRNGASPANGPSLTISDTNNFANDIVHFSTVTSDDLINFQSVPSGTPTTGPISISGTMKLIQPEQINAFIGGN